MSTNLMPEERFILEFIVGCFPYIFLLIVMMSRILQISHLPSNSSISSTISLRIKIFLTLSMAIVLIMLPILAYEVDGFWLYKRNVAFSLIFLIHSFVLILQTLLMRYEFKKQVPSPWYINLLFWAMIALLYFIFFMNSLLFQDFQEDSYIIIDFLRMVLGFALLGYGIYNKQDIENFKHQPLFFTKPLLANKKYSFIEHFDRKNLSPSFKEIINIPIKLTVKANKKSSNFDIKIVLPDITYTISHTLSEILENESKLATSLQTLKLEVPVNPPQITVFSEHPSKTASSICSFYRFFLENELFLSQRLLNFLQIPNPYRKRLLKKISEMQKREEFAVNNSYSSELSRSQYPEESELGVVGEVSDKNFCRFFTVEYIQYKQIGKDHYEFIFLLTLLDVGHTKQWTISRRYNDFLKLEEIFKKEHPQIAVPKLPGKQIFHNHDSLTERSLKLEIFLRILLNETVYLNENLLMFVDFFGDGAWNLLELSNLSRNSSKLSKELVNVAEDLENHKKKHEVLWETLNFPKIQGCYKEFVAKSFESKVSMEQNEKQFVLYAITIEENLKFKCKILKRYNDFEVLNQALHVRFKNEEHLLPVLPGKLDIFAGTQIKSRGDRLLEYLNSLFSKENIEDCYSFRKFIGIEVKHLAN